MANHKKIILIVIVMFVLVLLISIASLTAEQGNVIIDPPPELPVIGPLISPEFLAQKNDLLSSCLKYQGVITALPIKYISSWYDSFATQCTSVMSLIPGMSFQAVQTDGYLRDFAKSCLGIKYLSLEIVDQVQDEKNRAAEFMTTNACNEIRISNSDEEIILLLNRYDLYFKEYIDIFNKRTEEYVATKEEFKKSTEAVMLNSGISIPSRRDNCCDHCSIGKACGDTCIELSDICHVPPGCACDI